MRRTHPAKNAGLKNVGVLVLVDEDVVVETGDFLAELRRGFEQERPEKKQVVVIDEIPLLFAPRIVGVDPGEILEVVDELRVRIPNDVLDRYLGVDVPGVDVLQRLLLREALRFRRVPELRARELHQVSRIALIHDGEILGQSGRLAVATEQPVRCRVKGSAVNALAVSTHQPLGAGKHLLRGATCERQQKNPLGADSTLDEMRDPVDERAGLAGTGAGDDEKRAIAMRCGRRLLRIELRREVAKIPRSFSAWPGGVDPQSVTHATVSKRLEREVTTAVRSKASANLALTRSRTSCIEIASSPASRAMDVITTPGMPQGIMRSK